MVQFLERDAFRNAQLEHPLGVQFLEGHEAGASVEIMRASEPHPPQDWLGAFDRFGDHLYRWFRNHFADQFHSRFEQDAGQQSVFIALELTIDRIRGGG